LVALGDPFPGPKKRLASENDLVSFVSHYGVLYGGISSVLGLNVVSCSRHYQLNVSAFQCTKAFSFHNRLSLNFAYTFNTTIRGTSFSQRIIDSWNNLSTDVIDSNSVTQFKSRLDIFMRGQGFI